MSKIFFDTLASSGVIDLDLHPYQRLELPAIVDRWMSKAVRPAASDDGRRGGVVGMDPLKLTLEELLYVRLGHFFDQLNGRAVPDLYRVLLEQVDRAVLRQALERFDGQLGAAAKFLGVDRNTFARKARRLKVDLEVRLCVPRRWV